MLEANSETILIDCGPGVVAGLAKLALIPKLTAVLISHRHADHCADLTALAYARQFPVPLHPLPLYGPHDLLGTLVGLDKLFGIPSLPSLATPIMTALPFNALKAGEIADVAGLESHSFRMNHPVETLAYKFPDLSFTYTADGSLTDELVEFAKGSRTLLAECTYLKDTKADLIVHGHMTTIHAARLAEESGAEQLILTHFASLDMLDAVRNEVAPLFASFVIATPNVCVNL